MTIYDIASRLPSIEQLRQRCKALAMLERIVDGGWAYYAFTSVWGEDEAALMSNGSGDEWAVVFTTEGTFIRVFDHESPMSPFRDPDRELWPGLLDGLPAAFHRQVKEPAFGDEMGQFIATAVLWRLAGDDRLARRARHPILPGRPIPPFANYRFRRPGAVPPSGP